MESLVNKYTAEIPAPKWETSSESRREEAILLTGSTGRLGCYILNQLTEKENVVKIYALNRPSAIGLSAETRQKDALRTWGLSVNSEKIVFLEYDPSKDKLGLTDDIYSTV
jgi:thioester reductase-like protein